MTSSLNVRKFHCSWENRQQYVDSIRSSRMSELTCHDRMTALRAGMASVIPVQMLPIMSAIDAEVRICGLPEIDLDFLMVNAFIIGDWPVRCQVIGTLILQNM